MRCEPCPYNADWCMRYEVAIVHRSGTVYDFYLDAGGSGCGFKADLSVDASQCCQCAYEGGYGYFYGCLSFCGPSVGSRGRTWLTTEGGIAG